MNGQPRTFTGTGFIGGSGVSTRGEVFRLLDPMAFGSTLANLVATGPQAQQLRNLSDRMILTTVSGNILSTPSAIRPEVFVTSVSAMGAPAPVPSAVPPARAPESYLNCFGRCLSEKAPGLALEEVLNSACANALLIMGQMQAAAGPLSLSTLPASVVTLAGCVALTAGLTVGSVLECLIACAPGGRLTRAVDDDDDDEEDDDDDDDNGEFASGGHRAQRVARLTRIAVAIYREAAARGIRLTQQQVAQMLTRYQ